MHQIAAIKSSRMFIAILGLVFGVIFALPTQTYAAPSLVTVFRASSAVNGFHLQTTDTNEFASLLSPGSINHASVYYWYDEGPTFMGYVPTSGSCDTGLEPIFRLYNHKNTDHLLTADSNEKSFLLQGSLAKDWSDEGVAFCESATQTSGTYPVYRLVNGMTGEHLLTADTQEVRNLNGHNHWGLETNGQGGVVFYAIPTTLITTCGCYQPL